MGSERFKPRDRPNTARCVTEANKESQETEAKLQISNWILREGAEEGNEEELYESLKKADQVWGTVWILQKLTKRTEQEKDWDGLTAE